MTFTVYGLRLKGETETRYIGQTVHTPETRLRGLYSRHSSHWSGSLHCDEFGAWLVENLAIIEAFEIARYATRAEAKSAEKFAIAICLKLNHRLFNGDHVPHELRIKRKFQPISHFENSRQLSPRGRGDLREGRAPIAPGVRPQFAGAPA